MIDAQNSPKTALILDFDHTCYDTDAFLLFEIRQPLFERFNITAEEWEKSYEATVAGGYSVEKHLQELTKTQGMNLSEEKIKEIINNINFENYLYPDTLDFIKKAKEKGCYIGLLSFGYEPWQDKKVRGSGLDKFVDSIKYVIRDEDHSKANVVGRYCDDYERVIFVDNKGANLDEVHRQFEGVETYFINRVPDEKVLDADPEYIRLRYDESRKIAERQSVFEHKKCSSLSEIQI